MGIYKLTRQDFLESLKEQLYFLDSSLKSFSTNEIEAKRLATTIRVLIHDTNNSISLLKSLNKKDLINYINSASPNDGRLHSMTGMVGVRGSNPNQHFGLVAKINKEGKLIAIPLFQQHLQEWHKNYAKISFKDWWEMDVIKINSIGLSRKNLVLHTADKDGGAHIDESLPEQYYLTKTSKLILNIEGREVEFEKNVVYASVAQIGWELMNSINENEKS